MTWEPLAADQQNGVIQHYMVLVMEAETRTSLSLTSTATTLTIPNLHPAYTYSIQVAAVTISVGPYSEALSVVTPDDSELG